jgi:CRP-like cAMP-binding protein
MYPFISQRISQNLIASYLGLTTETISRIKKNLQKIINLINSVFDLHQKKHIEVT